MSAATERVEDRLRCRQQGGLAEAFDACARAILILLGRATANPARTDEDAAAEDRHSTLAEKHVVALGHDNATQRGMVGARR
jgi:hypothetical protein